MEFIIRCIIAGFWVGLGYGIGRLIVFLIYKVKDKFCKKKRDPDARTRDYYNRMIKKRENIIKNSKDPSDIEVAKITMDWYIDWANRLGKPHDD